MDKIIMHWGGSTYKASTACIKAYHFSVESDGTIIKGKFKPENNKVIHGKNYAMHTYHCNTGAIGVVICCMAGAKEKPLSYGKYPPTKTQVYAMCKLVAKLCIKYNIAVTNKKTLTHAEVQPNLGIKQKNKWDIVCLPWLGNVGAAKVGDWLRREIRKEIRQLNKKQVSVTTSVNKPKPKPFGSKKVIGVSFIAVIVSLIYQLWDKLITLLGF